MLDNKSTYSSTNMKTVNCATPYVTCRKNNSSQSGSSFNITVPTTITMSFILNVRVSGDRLIILHTEQLKPKGVLTILSATGLKLFVYTFLKN